MRLVDLQASASPKTHRSCDPRVIIDSEGRGRGGRWSTVGGSPNIVDASFERCWTRSTEICCAQARDRTGERLITAISRRAALVQKGDPDRFAAKRWRHRWRVRQCAVPPLCPSIWKSPGAPWMSAGKPLIAECRLNRCTMPLDEIAAGGRAAARGGDTLGAGSGCHGPQDCWQPAYSTAARGAGVCRWPMRGPCAITFRRKPAGR